MSYLYIDNELNEGFFDGFRRGYNMAASEDRQKTLADRARNFANTVSTKQQADANPKGEHAYNNIMRVNKYMVRKDQIRNGQRPTGRLDLSFNHARAGLM